MRMQKGYHMQLPHLGVWTAVYLMLCCFHLIAVEPTLKPSIYSSSLMGQNPKTLQGPVHQDQNHVYTISFPEGWTVDESDSNNISWVTARSPSENENDSYLENIQITYNQKASKTTLNEYLPQLLVFMKEKYANVEIIEIGSTKLADMQSKWILFTSQGPGESGEQVHLKAIHYALVADKHLMIILCVAPIERFDEWKLTFEQSLKTLKFLDNPS